ncbi:hypothetical protein ACOMHN_052542 [Nucella lapillus]
MITCPFCPDTLTMRAALTVVLVAWPLANNCLGQSALNFSQLHDDLLTLTRHVRPVKDASRPTLVNITFHLLSIITLDTVIQKLTSNGWMSVVWRNDYMVWDAERYGGIKLITPPEDRMWRPRLTVHNSLKELRAVGEDYIVLNVDNTGAVFWYPAERFETFCHIDVTFFPFDLQRCQWELFSWAEDSDMVILQSTVPRIDLDSYTVNGEWNLVDTRAWHKFMTAGPKNLSLLTYEVTIRRRPTLLALTVLLPAFVLSGTSVYVFTIPSEAGERLAYSMTSFLTFGVFMSFIVDLMPSSTESLSIMAACLSCQLIMSAVYVLLCILSLKVFHQDSHKHPIPATLQTVVVYIELMLCLDPPSYFPDSFSSSQGVSSEGSADFYGSKVNVNQLSNELDRWVAKRQVRQEAYTRPQDMTWQRVSRTLDKVLFRFFFGLVVVMCVVFFSIMTHHYHSEI